jgi:hypothetical protein
VLRWVVAGQIISGRRDLPSAEIHSITVIKVRLTPTPLQIQIITAGHYFKRAENAQEDSCLIHVVNILLQDG